MRQLRTCAIVFGLTISAGLCAGEGPISSPATGAAAGGATAPAIDPKETSAVDAAREFEALLGTALVKGLDLSPGAFDRAAQLFGLSKYKKGDTAREVAVRNGKEGRSILIRVRAEDGGRDIVLLSGRQEMGVIQVFFYVTSPEGKLLSVFYGKGSGQATRVDSRRYVDAHKAEIEFWRKWEQDVHRQIDE